MQKKRIARGAFAHISRKRGGCTLPSDLLTAKQRKEKNGEVKSYNISRPMPWREFKQMPDDLKREFYRNMQSFGGSAKWLAEEMGASDQTIRDSAERCGAPFRRGGRNLEMWQRKLAEWAIRMQRMYIKQIRRSCVPPPIWRRILPRRRRAQNGSCWNMPAWSSITPTFQSCRCFSGSLYRSAERS